MSSPVPTFAEDDDLNAVLADLNTAPVTASNRKPPGLDKSTPNLSLGQNHEGQSIYFFTDTSNMCMGLVGSMQTKFCTQFTCSTRSHGSKFAAPAGVYLKGGTNMLFCEPMVFASHIPLSLLEG
eukprot:15327064-Ditylum_brightwellii.AAC.1